jgi:sugar/nucleoside kinase (ribokinase family)
MIVVVGSIAFDTIETPFGRRENILGGSAIYFSLAASILERVGIIGVVGEDFTDEYLNYLKSKNIDIEGIKRVKGKTFHWDGYYEYDMNQAHTVKTELNVFANFHPEIPANYKNSEYLFLANIDPELQIEVLNKFIRPKLVVADTMNYWIEKKRDKVLEVIRRTDVMLLNDGEARELFKTPNILKAAKSVLNLGAKVVIIKKGEHGAIMFTKETIGSDEPFIAPAFPLEEVIDPTGAGDSFAGGFLSFLSKSGQINETSLRKAVIYATVLASFTVMDFGPTQLDKVSYNEIKVRYNKLLSYTKFGKI